MKKAGNSLSLSPSFSGVFLVAAMAAFSLSPISSRAQDAPVTVQPETMQPEIAAPAADPTPTSWLTYKADLQRTGAVNVRLGAAPNLLWRHSTEIEAKTYDTSPLVVGPEGQRRIYFAVDQTIFCIDAQTGAQIWRSEALPRSVVSPIILLPGDTGDLILAITSSGQLNALRTSDGAQAWQIGSAAPVQNTAPVLIKTAGGDRIMLALATGRLVAFTLDGKLDPTWEVQLGSFASSPTSTPAISPDGRFLYIPTQDKKLFVVDILAGKVAFPIALRVGAYASPVYSGDQILIVTDTALSSLKQRTGQTSWIFDVKSALSAPAVSRVAKGRMVFVGARNGKFYAVNAASGAKAWEADLGEPVTGSPTVTEDMVLVGTRNGVLFGLAPSDGRVLWRYRLHTERVLADSNNRNNNNRNSNNNDRNNRTRQPATAAATLEAAKALANAPIWDTTETQTFGATSQPVVVDGQIYMLADNAALYAFGTQPFDAESPQVSNTQLSVPNSLSRPMLQRLDPEKPLLIPGQAPIQLVAELNDVGSGIDPASIVVKLNNQDLPKTAVVFVDATGKLTVTLAEIKDRVGVNLTDGMYGVSIAARDYRGNETSYSVNFLVDNTVSPPVAPPADRNNNNNNRGNWNR